MLYSFNKQEPQELPFRITLSNGQTRTDSSTFTSAEIVDAGWVAVEDKPQITNETEKVVWNSDTLSWDVISLSSLELTHLEAKKWELVRHERDIMLAQSDIRMLRELESNGVVSEQLKSYRQGLRDVPNVNTDPDNIIWPTDPDIINDSTTTS